MTPALLEELNRARSSQTAAVLVRRLNNGKASLMVDGTVVAGEAWPEALDHAVLDALRTDRSARHDVDGEPWFVHVFNAPLRLIVVGAVHIAQALVPMAKAAGYAVTVVDPRSAFASEARFPGVALMHDWPDDALLELALDHRCAVVTLTHDPKIDDPALETVLKTPAFYVAALGSRRTHAARVERLAQAGFSPGDIDRIYGPAGLPLGAETPAEIAISILAEMTAALRQRSDLLTLKAAS